MNITINSARANLEKQKSDFARIIFKEIVLPYIKELDLLIVNKGYIAFCNRDGQEVFAPSEIFKKVHENLDLGYNTDTGSMHRVISATGYNSEINIDGETGFMAIDPNKPLNYS